MVALIPLLAVLMSPAVVYGQSSKLEWAPEEMFDPIKEPRKCGILSDEPAFVCDPNGILGDDLASFNWKLRDAAFNSTKCPCSNYYCENSAGAVGYRIGLALVRKMKLQKGLDNKVNDPKDQAQLFAYRLEKDRWNMGNCEEDIIIFYSVEDNMLAMYAGSTAAVKLTPHYRNLLAYRVSSRLEDGRIVPALNNLIYDLKVVLDCEESVTGAKCGLNELRAGAASLGVSMVTASAALMMALYNFVL